MSRIIDLNDKLNNRAYNFYCLDSHNEFTFILESYGKVLYAYICGFGTVTNNCKTKVDNLVKNQCLEIMSDLTQQIYNQ